MSSPCLNAFNGSHCLEPKFELFISMAHRPFMTWPNLSPINPNHALDTVIILHVPSTWHAFSYLRAFVYAVTITLRGLPMFAHLSGSHSSFQICSSSIFSKSLNNKLCWIPALCFPSTLCILYHVMLKLSIYLSRIFTSSLRTRTKWTHKVIWWVYFI